MLTESQITMFLFAMTIAMFIVFVLHSVLVAKFVEAPNNSLDIASIASVFIFIVFAVLLFLLKSLNLLFNAAYAYFFLVFAVMVNVLIFCFFFNVDLIKGCLIVMLVYTITIALTAFIGVMVLYLMGFNNYDEMMRVLEPNMRNLMFYLGYARW